MTRSFLRDSIFNAVGGLTASLADLVSGIVVARVLGASGAGSVALAVWIALVISRFVNFGLPLALSRYLPEIRVSNNIEQAEALAAAVLRKCSLISTGLLACATLILVLDKISYISREAWVGFGLNAVTWALIFILAAVQGVANPALGYLNGMQKFKYLGIILVLSAVLRLVSISIGSILFGVMGALVGNALGAVAPILIAFRPMLKRAAVDRELRKRVVRFCNYAWVSQLIETLVWSRAELFFVARYWGAELAGLYSVGLSLVNMAVLLPTLMANPLLPYFSEQAGGKSFDDLRATYTSATVLIGFIVIPTCFGLATICPVIIPLVFGEQFSPATLSAMIIVASASVSLIANPAAKLIFVMERGSIFIWSNSIGSVLLVALGVVVIPDWSILGAALARLVSQLAVVSLELWYVARCIGYPVPTLSLAKIVIASVSSSSVAYLCTVKIASPMSLTIAIPLSCIVYVVATRYLQVLGQHDSNLIMTAIQHTPSIIHKPVVSALRFATGRSGQHD
jgi:O-antigen/teichoic acid export membrane protein